jgi:hypothetical protein
VHQVLLVKVPTSHCQLSTAVSTQGFSFERPVLYLSTDANDPVVASLEGATYAPGLREVTVGHDDGAFSAVERLFLFANGPTGKGNPQRQGLNSALSDGLSPLNVLGGIPTVATLLPPPVSKREPCGHRCTPSNPASTTTASDRGVAEIEGRIQKPLT